jgi:hypothetical protein
MAATARWWEKENLMNINEANPVLDGLRKALQKPKAETFREALKERIHQLLANMVDGRVLPKADATDLRGAILELVRTEALPTISKRNPAEGLRILDMLKAYGFPQLEELRPQLVTVIESRFPPPAAATWPELGELRSAAQLHPEVCKIAPPVQNVWFAEELRGRGLTLPDELLALYAACNGFDLSCLSAPYLPVLSLLPASAIDTDEEAEGYPARATVFFGEDEVHFAVYCDRKKRWWLSYEHEYQPVAKKPLDIREVIRFGISRMNAPTDEALLDELSWERFFGRTGNNTPQEVIPAE